MNSRKLSPLGYAVAAFLLVPFALVIGAILWPVLPVAVYFATKKRRPHYGTIPLEKKPRPDCFGSKPNPRDIVARKCGMCDHTGECFARGVSPEFNTPQGFRSNARNIFSELRRHKPATA